MRQFLCVFVVGIILSSCGENEAKDKGAKQSDTTTIKMEIPQTNTPENEGSEIQDEPEDNTADKAMERDAKRYAEILCMAQKHGQNDQMVRDLQQIIDRYPAEPESSKFGRIVDQEFNRICK